MGVAAGSEGDGEPPTVAELRRRVSKAEAAAERLAEQAQVLRNRLCLDEELDALTSEVAKMQILVKQQAPLADDESRLSNTMPEEVDDAMLEETRVVLESDASFEMLASAREMA